ncbi:MAG: polysaccharide deacetylase family protein [Meiothermus sp.]|nr:polysaccharide deacetylase family protein [Meiothermus sp.]
MRTVWAALKSWEFWLVLVCLAGVALTTLHYWYNPFLPSRDLGDLSRLGLPNIQTLYARQKTGKQTLKIDAATRQLQAQLLEARFRPMNPRASGEAIVLNYHDVFPRRTAETVWYDTTPEEFGRDIAWLKARKATFISLDQLRHHLTRNKPLPPDAVAVTFDDNHQGFYDHIYPIIRREKIPVAIFVHTDFVGRQTGRRRMSWETLQELSRDPLITIGSHTLSHRVLATLPQAEQRRELLESKWLLERKLGRPVVYVAYPEGKADALTFKIAREVGYAMGFTIDWRLPVDSPDMLSVGRYIQTQLQRAWFELNPEQFIVQERRRGLVERGLKDSPIRAEYPRLAGVSMALIRGGRAESRLSAYRESVSAFVEQAGAVAGINGTFFADPYLRARDNTMVGPIMATQGGGGRAFIPERNPYIMYRIVERPLVAWNERRIVFVPVKLDMNSLETIKSFMPAFTDVFVGGAWIVKGGRAVWPLKNPPSDHAERRPRVFFGYSKGEVVLGASLNSVSTVALARAAALAGVEEAVLLDSGYSTSLVFQDKLLAVGRRWDGVPSRPVPHAIVLHGRVGREVAAR